MRNFLHTSGEYSCREQRLLRRGEIIRSNEMPEPNGPREAGAQAEIRETTSQEEVLQTFMQNLEKLKNQTTDVANQERQRVVETAQRDLDTVLKTPSAARDFVTNYLIQTNKSLYPQGLQMRYDPINQTVSIQSYAPTVFAPEAMERQRRIKELETKIGEVNTAIEGVMKGFRQDAVDYRFRKKSAMNRRNYSPEISRMLMQSSMESMRDTLPSRDALLDMRRQLTLELARVKSAPLSDFRVPPEYGPHSRGSAWCPPGSVPYGAPRGGMPTPAHGPEEGVNLNDTQKREIDGYVKEWNDPKTPKIEKAKIEARLMMAGVNVAESDLASGRLTIAPSNERPLLELVGAFRLLLAWLESGGFSFFKKAPTKADGISEKNPRTMTPPEIATETAKNKGDIATLTTKKKTAEKECETMKIELNNPTTAPEGEDRIKLDQKIKDATAEIVKIDAEIKKLEKRNEVLKDPTKFVDPEKGIVKGEALNGDENYAEFERSKNATKANIRAQLPGLLKSPAGREGLQRSGIFFGIDLSKIDTEVETITSQIMAVTDSIIDNVSLERNSEGQYRMRMDFGKIYEAMLSIFDPSAKKENELSDAVKLKFTELMTQRGPFVSMEGTTAVTGFMSGEDLNSNGSFLRKLKSGAAVPEELPAVAATRATPASEELPPPASVMPVPPMAESPEVLPSPVETIPAPTPAPLPIPSSAAPDADAVAATPDDYGPASERETLPESPKPEDTAVVVFHSSRFDARGISRSIEQVFNEDYRQQKDAWRYRLSLVLASQGAQTSNIVDYDNRGRLNSTQMNFGEPNPSATELANEFDPTDLFKNTPDDSIKRVVLVVTSASEIPDMTDPAIQQKWSNVRTNIILIGDTKRDTIEKQKQKLQRWKEFAIKTRNIQNVLLGDAVLISVVDPTPRGMMSALKPHLLPEKEKNALRKDFRTKLRTFIRPVPQ